MMEAHNEAQTQAQTDTASDNILQRSYDFNFRSQDIDQVAEDVGGIEELAKPEVAGQFTFFNADKEEVKNPADAKKAKRKTVSATLTLPAFITLLPEDEQKTVADVLENTVATYVKQAYIDQWQPVGDHSWETIKKWLNSRGSRTAKWDFTKETLALAANAFGKFAEQVIGVAGIAGRLEQAAKQRFSRNAIQRNTGKFDEDVVTKLQARIDEFMAYVLEHDEDNAEDFSPVYQCWSETLERHLKADHKQVDLSEVL